MDYLNDIKELIEKDIILKKKHRLIENNYTLNTYFVKKEQSMGIG